MKLSSLRYLVSFADEGSISRAAERCHVSQPTLSVALQNLEAELGVSLIERNKGHVSLTDLGHQFDKSFAIANEDLARETPDKTAAVHFMRFELSPGMAAAVKLGAMVRAGIDHPACFEATQIPEAVRDSLASDLT